MRVLTGLKLAKRSRNGYIFTATVCEGLEKCVIKRVKLMVA